MTRAYRGILKPIVVLLGVFLSFQLAFGWVHTPADVECPTGFHMDSTHSNDVGDSMEPATHGVDCQNHHCVNCVVTVDRMLSHWVPLVSNSALDPRVLNLQVHHQPRIKPPRSL